MRRSIKLTAIVAMLAAVLAFEPARSADGEEPVLIAADAVGDAAIDPTLSPLGLDAVSVEVHQPDYSKPEIQFILRVAELNAPPPHEVIRYMFEFNLNGVEYWISAKMSDMSTATMAADDPVGHFTHPLGAFRLRGFCGVTGAVNTCRHLLWLDGEFDLDRNEIRVRVPFNDPAAPAFAPGGLITPLSGGGFFASVQAGVSNDSTSDIAFQCASYEIPVGPFSSGAIESDC